MYRIFGGRSEYLKTPKHEVERQWLRHLAEVKFEQEQQEQLRKEMQQ